MKSYVNYCDSGIVNGCVWQDTWKQDHQSIVFGTIPDPIVTGVDMIESMASMDDSNPIVFVWLRAHLSID